MADPILTAAELRNMFDYDPDSGILRWRVRPSQAVKAGSIAGSVESNGYVRIRILGKKVLAHRIAWAIYYGEFPNQGVDIDHVDGDKSNNRISNLRLATRSQNCANRPAPRVNTSGFKGVYLNSRNGKYHAQIGVDGTRHHLGFFDTKEEAGAAFRAAALRIFGEYAYQEG